MKTRAFICALALWPMLSSAQDILAYWSFNNSSDPTKSMDNLKNFVGDLAGGAKFGPGRTGGAGDFSLDVSADTSAVMRVEDGSWVNKAGENDQLSVVFWQKNTGDIRDQSAFWFDSPSSQGRGAQAHTPWSNNNIYFDTAGCCDGSTRTNMESGLEDADWRKWNHLAFIKNKEIKQIWVNGSLLIENTNDAPLAKDFEVLHIGNASGDNASVPGLIDDFGVYAGALTEAQIKQLAGGSSPIDLLDSSDPGNDLPATIDFGNLPSLPGATELQVPIRNTGATKDLLISSLKVLSGDTANITVVSFPDKIAPKQVGNVKLAFDAKGVFKRFEVTLETKTNDPDAADQTILTKVSATVLGADSDKDGLTDTEEVNTYKTGVFNSDSDGDGLSDFAEVKTHKTNPLKADSDGDGFADGLEIEKKSDPNDAKSDPLSGSPNRFNLLAYWNFDDASNPDVAVDKVAKIALTSNGAQYSADKGGRSGKAGDRSVSTLEGNLTLDDASFANPAGEIDKMTVSFWQKLDAEANSSAFWFNGDGAGGDRAFQAHTPWSDGTIYFDTSGCCGGGTQRISGRPPEGHDFVSNWSHYAFVKDGPDKSVWVNGTRAFGGRNTAKLVKVFTRLSVGSDSGQALLQGSLDEFAVFGSALGQAEIAKLAAGTAPDQLSGGQGGQQQPTSPFALGDVRVVSGKLRLNFGSSAGASYDVEVSEDLKTWTKLSTIVGAGTSTTSDVDPGLKRSQFYRIKRNG